MWATDVRLTPDGHLPRRPHGRCGAQRYRSSATTADVKLRRAKIDIAQRLTSAAATADKPAFVFHEFSIWVPDGLAIALDYDLVVCRLDRPLGAGSAQPDPIRMASCPSSTAASADVIPDGKGVCEAGNVASAKTIQRLGGERSSPNTGVE